MSVAWILTSGEVYRMSRETVPAPQALSWIMEFGGMEVSSERLWAANWAVTAPPVASYMEMRPWPERRAEACAGCFCVLNAILETTQDTSMYSRLIYVLGATVLVVLMLPARAFGEPTWRRLSSAFRFALLD